MNVDKLASIGMAIVTVAGVTVIVSHPTSAKLVGAFGQAFAGAIRAAMGR